MDYFIKEGVVFVTEHTKDESKEIVQKVIRDEKVKVLVYPVSIFALIYGVWMFVKPEILETYKVYSMISNIVTPQQVGSVFITIAIIMLVGYKLKHRNILYISSLAILSVWSVFTFAFLFSPPPNTVWILALTWTYFSFELTRRV